MAIVEPSLLPNNQHPHNTQPGIQRFNEDKIPNIHTMGFRFVRSFLWIILGVVSCMVGLIVFFGWHLGMEVTVEGQGHIEPITRLEVKAERPGLIQTVCVQHGQVIQQGDLLLTLDDNELQSELEQIQNDIAINRSRDKALRMELQRERAVRETEIIRAQMEHQTTQLQLEQAQREYQINHKYRPYLFAENAQKTIDTLIPIRLYQARVKSAEIEIEHATRRLATLDNRAQELKALAQMQKKMQISRHLITTRLNQTKIYAPVSGTVLTRDLDKRIGDHIKAGEAVIELAKLNGWQAQITVQEVDIPKVKKNQVVRLYINAFPHMEYKTFEGLVTDVPRKPEPSRPLGAGLAPHASPSAVYPVKVNIADPYVSDGKKEYSLVYGMGVNAKIVTDRGAIVDLFWKKFLKTIGKVGHPEIYRLNNAAETQTN